MFGEVKGKEVRFVMVWQEKEEEEAKEHRGERSGFVLPIMFIEPRLPFSNA